MELRRKKPTEAGIANMPGFLRLPAAWNSVSPGATGCQKESIVRKDSSGSEKRRDDQRTVSIEHGWRLDVLTLDFFIEGTRPRALRVTDIWSTRTIRFEPVMNQHTIVQTLKSLVISIGYPAFLLCADVPELRSDEFCVWARSRGLDVRYITAAEVAAELRRAKAKMAFRMIQGASGRVN
jgi:hypothetical protein